MDFDWKSLKSGTDLRGVASEGGAKPVALTPDRARQVGAAFAALLREIAPVRGSGSVAVGHDSRTTGPALAKAVRQGLAAAGVRVLDVGLCTTPAMFMTLRHPATACDGAVMVTASHLPSDRNGLKFFGPEGGLNGKQIDRLLERVSALAPVEGADACTRVDFLPLYRQSLTDLVTGALGARPLEGLHVVVDAGNGAGGFYADWLENLGASTEGSQFLEPDGRFPGHIPNPEDAGAMEALSKAVLAVKADLGVIFDADCDRAALVDADGSAINRDRLIALCAAMVLAEQPGATIVTDSVTSTGLASFIAAHGGKHHRFKRGYRNVIDEAIRLDQSGTPAPLAMETSGHAALKENHYLDDGMYLVTRLLIEAVRARRAGRSLTACLESLSMPLEERELRIPIDAPDFRAAGEAAMARLTAWLASSDYRVAPKNYEGIRVQTAQADGWFLLRLSLHDPLLVFNAQSDRAGGVQAMLNDLYRALEGAPGIRLQSNAQS